MKIETKDHVHVCPICDQGHINHHEFMKICQPCFREHEIDLGFMEWAIKDSKMIEEALDKHADKFMNGLITREKEHLAKVKRSNQISIRWAKAYFIIMIYWIGYWIGQVIFQ